MRLPKIHTILCISIQGLHPLQMGFFKRGGIFETVAECPVYGNVCCQNEAQLE